jgi:hypothetical protein
VDAFVGFTYPNERILAAKQAITLGINFKVFHVNVGPSFGFFSGIFDKALDGIMCGGAWNFKSSPGAKKFCNTFISRYGEPTVDWWGHLSILPAEARTWHDCSMKHG